MCGPFHISCSKLMASWPVKGMKSLLTNIFGFRPFKGKVETRHRILSSQGFHVWPVSHFLFKINGIMAREENEIFAN